MTDQEFLRQLEQIQERVNLLTAITDAAIQALTEYAFMQNLMGHDEVWVKGTRIDNLRQAVLRLPEASGGR